MDTRQTRSRAAAQVNTLPDFPVLQTILSDTEEMEDEEEEAGREDSDSQEVFFVPQSTRQRMVPQRIQDTEEMTEGDGNQEMNDITDDEEDNLSLAGPQTRRRYHRIYQPDTDHAIDDDEDEEDDEDYVDVEFNSDDYNYDDSEDDDETLSRSASEEEEGRISSNSNGSLIYVGSEMEALSDDDMSMHQNSNSGDEAVATPPEPIEPEAIAPSNSEGISGDEAVATPPEPIETEAIAPSNSEDVRTSSATIPGDSNAFAPSISGPSTSVPDVAAEVCVASSSNTATALKIDDDNEDEGQSCPICMERWTSAGQHRIVTLKCGHLFGNSCIERWVKKPGAKCPQCNAKASKKDIRVIYAHNLKVQDTSETERLAQEIERVKREKAALEKEKAKMTIKNSIDSKLIQDLKQQLLELKESVGNNPRGRLQNQNEGGSNPIKRYKLAFIRAFELVNRNGSCRVIAFNEWMNMLVISIQSQLDIFPGFGIKKFNTLDLKLENYVHLHSKQVRDLAFNPNKRDLLLSVGIDKVAKITNVGSNATVLSYTTDYALWSCCWNTTNSSQFFAGTSVGAILHFDTVKNTNEPIKTYQIRGSGPVVSVSYVPPNPDKNFNLAGLIVTKLTSVFFVEILVNGFEVYDLPIEGSFTHTAFDPISRHLLTTCRPTDKNPHARHILCDLSVVNMSDDPTRIHNVVSAREVFSFQGSTTMKVLSRACVTFSPSSEEGNPVVIFSEESTGSIKVYDVRTASQIQIVKSSSHVIDILPVKGPDGKYVAMLSEKTLTLYKWIEQL